MLPIVRRLLLVPRRQDGILEEKIANAFELFKAKATLDTFAAYASDIRTATVRDVLSDARFHRWLDVNAKKKVGRAVMDDLVGLEGITEEEYVLDGEPQPEVPPESPLGRELRARARSEGVEEILDERAVWLAPFLPSPLRRRFRAAPDITVLEAVADSGPRLSPVEGTVVLSAAYRFLASVGAQARRVRAARSVIEQRALAPVSPDAKALLARLDEELARLAAQRPRRHAGVTVTGGASFDLGHQSLRYVEDDGGKRREVLLRLGPEFEPSWSPSALSVGERHALVVEALHAFRDVVRDPKHPAHASLHTFVSEAPWERVLRTLGEVVRTAPPERTTDVATEQLVWQVGSTAYGVNVHPCITRIGAMGREPVGGHARLCEPIENRRIPMSASDERALAILQPLRTSHFALDDDAARGATFEALVALADSHHLYDASSLATPLAVRAGELRTAFVERDGGHAVAFCLGGQPLAPAIIAEGLGEDGRLIHLAREERAMYLSRVSRLEAAVFRRLAAEPAVFPPEARPLLMEHIRILRQEVAIELPDGFVETTRPADGTLLFRLTPQGAALSVALRVRLAPDGPVVVPGEGQATVLYGERGGCIALTRDLGAEREAVSRLARELGIPDGVDARTMTVLGFEPMLDFLQKARATGLVLEWPEGKPLRVEEGTWSRLRIQARDRRDWFGLSGELELDEGSVPLAALLDALRRKERFVALGPGRFVALTEELRERLGRLGDIAFEGRQGLELAKSAVPRAAAALEGLSMLEVPAPWTTLLARVATATAATPMVPRTLCAKLRPYQLEGYRWLAHLAAWGAGACLADDMGLGKTVQTLAILLQRAALGPALVLAPTSVGANWEREASRFAPSLRVRIYRGSDRATMLDTLGPSDLLVTSYDIAVRDGTVLAEMSFATLVLDEAHAIKNADTQRASMVRSLRAEWLLALTGTPVENRLGDLWSLMSTLNPGLLGSAEQFRERYALPIEREGDASRSRALAETLRPFVLRRTKSEVLAELPPRIEMTRTVELAPAERRAYEDARVQAILAIKAAGENEDARFRVLAEITRLRQLACHPRMLDPQSLVPSSKMATFLALVEQLRAEGHRALVFSQFTKHLALVEEALTHARISFLVLDGSTPAAERTRRVERFQAGEADVFLISVKAGGTGLNLTAASYVIHLDPWWNPAVEDQATDRAHRIGQTRTVTVVRLVAQGTIEEAVLSLHAEKRELAAAVLEGTGAAGKLSTRELSKLIHGARAGARAREISEERISRIRADSSSK